MIAEWPKRRPGLVLAALALVLLGSLFPRGYMPVGTSHRVTVVLCSASGERTASLDLGKKSAPRRHSGSSNCDGLFTGLAVMPTETPTPARHAGWVAARALPLPRVAVARYFHFDPNAPPHAPPTSIG